MTGIPIGQVDRLREAGVDIPRLARAGVEVFFTQVFRDGYFHADMHPGNIFVATGGPHHGKYIAVDFGIMGTLSERDQGYLAQNFLAFFRRDYHRVATAHLESGWVPAGHARRRAGGRDPRRAGARVRPAAVGDLARPRAAAALPRVAPLQRRDPAAARAAAEDAAQHRGPRPGARSEARPVGHRDAVPRALDERPDRPAGAAAAAARRGAVHRRGAARAAAAHPSAPHGASARRRTPRSGSSPTRSARRIACCRSSPAARRRRGHRLWRLGLGSGRPARHAVVPEASGPRRTVARIASAPSALLYNPPLATPAATRRPTPRRCRSSKSGT